MNKFLILLFAFVIACTQIDPSTDYNSAVAPLCGIDSQVWLDAGQSNTLERARADQAGGEAYATAAPGAVTWKYLVHANGTILRDSEAWEPAPTGIAFGADRVLSYEWNAQQIVVAAGASKLSRDWMPGRIHHTDLVREVDAALSALGRGTLDGMVWWQGTNDANDAVAAYAYQENLSILIADLRARYGDFPVVIVLLHPLDQRPYTSVVRAEQQAYVASDPNSVAVDTAFYPNDGAHFFTAGYVGIAKDVHTTLAQRGWHYGAVL